MEDKLIGGLLVKARNAALRWYAASACNVGRLMRMFHGTIEELAAVHDGKAEAFEAVDIAVGWLKLLRVREEVQEFATITGEDPLVCAADRWRTLRKFAPALIEALQFRSTRAGDPMLGAVKLLAGLNQHREREVPADALMLFGKEWRRLVGGAARTGAYTRRPFWPRGTTSWAPVISESNARPAIAVSTVTWCHRMPPLPSW